MEAELAHLRRLCELIEIERRCAIEETQERYAHWSPSTLARHGLCLLGLRKTGERLGYGGKWILDFEAGISGQQPLPEQHTFRVGDVIQLTEWSKAGKKPRPGTAPAKADVASQGIVSRVTDTVLSAAFKEDNMEEKPQSYRIDKLVNEVTFERIQWILRAWLSPPVPLSNYIKTILGCDAAMTWGRTSLPRAQASAEGPLAFFNPSLNASQQAAVQLALEADHVALIHGPPGTGKTQTVIEIIRQLHSRQKRLLVCGPSNISIDNIVERLQAAHVPCARLGHPARVLSSVTHCTLDVQLQRSDDAQIIGDIRREIQACRDKAGHRRTEKPERRTLYQDIKALRKDLKVREKAAVVNMMKNTAIVCATLTGCGSRTLREQTFDVVIIDEATQAIEPESYLALSLGEKVILAGDHLQLPPTIQAEKAKALEKTLFMRLLDRYGEQCKALLDTQYRMHATIMEWSSQLLYGGKLKADPSVAEHLLCDLAGIAQTPETEIPLVVIDTAGCQFLESEESNEDRLGESSKYNRGEVDLTSRYVTLLLAAGVAEDQIAIISPYNAQVALLKKVIKEAHHHIEIGSVDGFQGREKEVILISLVRSNENGEVGFLKETRRLNVAITRARRHVCVVCDTSTLERGGKDLKSLVEYLHDNGEVRLANEEF